MGIRPLALGGVWLWFWLFCFGCFLRVFCFLVLFSPSSSCVSIPFNDDLGTPPTRRPYSWKKRPQQERTDIVWVQATHANGLRAVPYYWAGVFALEAARFLFPQVHFGLVDNDCVPVTLFEVKDLIALAESQFRWPDLVGHGADPDLAGSKLGMLLFTEAHLEYNAGLVISIGSTSRPGPVEATSTADNLAEELEDYRQQLLAMAAPPECPTDASQGGSLFTPLIGVPMENSLDLAVVWAL